MNVTRRRLITDRGKAGLSLREDLPQFPLLVRRELRVAEPLQKLRERGFPDANSDEGGGKAPERGVAE